MSQHPLAASVPPISDDLFTKMENAFPQIEIVPNVTTQDEIMYNAGQRALIKWLDQFRRSSIITGSR